MAKYLSKEKIQYLFYVVTHPADGFYEIRHRERGSVVLALLITILFSFSFSMNRLLASFVVNETDPREVNSLFELGAILLLVLLICVGNWSITCLMEGEGRFKDIFIVVGYSLTPVVLTLIPATLLSNVLAANEEGFYQILIFLGIAWGIIMLLIGIMTVHNYTLGKTLITMFLSCVAMFIIIFIIILINDLVQQVYLFVQSIYFELLLRG